MRLVRTAIEYRLSEEKLAVMVIIIVVVIIIMITVFRVA